MVTQRARTSLLAWADALHRHAQIIEQVTVKLRDIRETAAAGNAFRDYVLSCANPSLADKSATKAPQVRLKQRAALSQNSFFARLPDTLCHSRILSIEFGNHDSKCG